jgi:hypothetical protein
MEPTSPSPDAPPSDAAIPRRDWTLPAVLVVAAALVGALLAAFGEIGQEKASSDEATTAAIAQSWTPSPRPTGETVSLTIDFGNGARRVFDALPYAAGMTLGQLMQRARTFRPPVVYSATGKGKMSFLTSLEGVANEGAGGRSWLYSVDGRHGEVSFAVQSLAAGSAVLWEFRRGE